MKTYDVIVIGSGSGMTPVEGALQQAKKVALIDKGPLGGTCLNVGCIPSKLLVYPADRIVEIQEAKKFGINATITDIDFEKIMNHMRETIKPSQEHMRKGINNMPNLDFYGAEAHFTDDYILEVQGETIKGKKIFIVSGARPTIPPIQGIQECPYLTNDTIFGIKEKPQTLLIIGGGYIAAEFGHFFAAMGTHVTIVGRNKHFVPTEEPELSTLLQKEMGKRMAILTDTEAVAIKKDTNGCTLTARNNTTKKETYITAEHVLVAAGRTSNADILQVEKTGVHTDNRGYITVNDALETSKKNIWAWGDAIGKYMFRHTANNEAEIAWHNANHKQNAKMDYKAIPHAVFSYPPIAGVGMTQQQAAQSYDILIGHAHYSDVAKGEAMMETEGFAKAIVEKNTGHILGFHIIGPYAPILIQEIIDIMAIGGTISHLAQGIHIHPALPELILATMGRLHEPETNN